ncbi:MAG: hypothetical protein E5X73_21470 [Mesorhizobium sp.]|nr:MAG: hypothetical protein E5X73_21470 [Mesorhizobium sp.]
MVWTAGGVGMTGAQTFYADQGESWTESRRIEFYFKDQGSRIMPLAWMRALTLPTGEAFLHDALARYGYLSDENAPERGVPVGFTIAPASTGPAIGMTCAACHTRQIVVNGLALRIDGGPAMVDFQAFLSDLDAAMGRALQDDTSFASFATRVLGPEASSDAQAELKESAELWHLRFSTLMARSLPDPAWGPGRLDAVSMIFNRVAGLDLGEPPSMLIPENIEKADAPTRYPFLWNAGRQDMTQWPGFAANGSDLLALSRNLGEVYGVFGEFQPVKQSGGLLRLDRDYVKNNSANFDGLRDLEDLIWQIGPPRWPWEIDEEMAAKGEKIFNRSSESGGCVDCHGIKTGEVRDPFRRTWATPIKDVGTDARECAILLREVKTGVLAGAKLPFLPERIGQQTDKAFTVLSTSVIGAIVQHAFGNRSDAAAKELEGLDELPPEFDALREAFPSADDLTGMFEAVDGGCPYEARVLQGIWASAPYLHNGSVMSLADLLKPASERTKSFKLGPNYDIETVGLAVEQTAFDYTLNTTGCDEIDSGNSRCGHEYGTEESLTPKERTALLEYLKTL